MIVVPMTIEHVMALEPQASQSGLTYAERLRDAAALMEQGPCYAAIDDDGVMCLGGISRQWAGRAVAWVLISKHANRKMLALTKIIGAYLKGENYRRVEMYVDAQFKEGCRWAEILGFKKEGLMQAFMPNGNDAYMYGRVQ